MSCLPWFKFRSTAPEEYEVHALCGVLGSEADAYLYRLWAYCARERADGRFPGDGAEAAVERAVRWRGKRGRLVKSLLSIGLLVREDDGLVVQRWEDEQGAHVAKVERDRAKPDSKARTSPEAPSVLPPSSPEPPARESRGESGEKRAERREERNAEASSPRVREDAAQG
ncbi:hypothetical protein D7X74_21825, partial [Corallococcus sp. CA047B]